MTTDAHRHAASLAREAGHGAATGGTVERYERRLELGDEEFSLAFRRAFRGRGEGGRVRSPICAWALLGPGSKHRAYARGACGLRGGTGYASQ